MYPEHHQCGGYHVAFSARCAGSSISIDKVYGGARGPRDVPYACAHARGPGAQSDIIVDRLRGRGAAGVHRKSDRPSDSSKLSRPKPANPFQKQNQGRQAAARSEPLLPSVVSSRARIGDSSPSFSASITFNE